MFGHNFTLFTILGFRVRANVSWLFLAILVTWSLAAGFFPATYPGLPAATYWSLAVIGTIGLFFSLLFHEFSHSLVARARGLEMTGITLFLFGGVAEMPSEPKNPRTEFWMAIAGPLSSLLLAAVFYGVFVVFNALGVPAHVAGIPRYLALINVVLAVFNMVPGFPLDGGRVLRAALWHFKGDLQWATRWATRMGQGFGLFLAALGVLSAFQGNFTAGLWWFLIGLFLHGAATASYQRMATERGLSGVKVRDVMTRDPVTVPADSTVQAFVDDYLYRYSHDLFPVVSGSRLVGCLTLADVQSLDRAQWPFRQVADIARRCDADITAGADDDAIEALMKMQKAGASRLIVADERRVVGILTLKDLLHRLTLRNVLESRD